MLLFIASLPTPLLMAVCVGISIVVAIAGVYLARRFVRSDLLREHNDVAGYIYSMLGVVYAVLLAFVVFVVWQEYQTVSEAVDHEANAVITLYRTAAALPEPTRTQLQTDVRAYTQAVIGDEWTHLGRFERGPLPGAELGRLWTTGTGFEPHTMRESALYSQVLQDIQAVNTLRAERFQADRTRIPGILWTLLLGGGMIIVVFTFFFGTTSGRLHALMAAALASVIAFTLVLIFALNHPFAGSVRIGPEPFRSALTLFQTLGR